MSEFEEEIVVGLIGCGNMGAALVAGWLTAPHLSLRVFDRHPERVQGAAGGSTRLVAATSPVDAARGADVVVLAVKPKGIAAMAAEVLSGLREDSLIVSVAAGVKLQAIEEAAPGAAVVRSMPNVGSALRAGTTAAVLGRHCDPERDRPRLEQVFSPVGSLRIAAMEEELHGATALAGSGPAFLLMVLEAMIDAGVEVGLRRADAEFYAAGALRAASALADTKEPPAVTRARITSPGGTTIAGLNAMEQAGARAALQTAVTAAVARSRAMGEE